MKGNFFSWARRVMACVVCGVMAVSMVWAERVSEADAALVADHFMNVTSSSAHGQKAPAKRMVLKKAAVVEENQFYIYENADGEGWVMVAANDVARPILAYSETGHFRTDNMPRNVKGWLQSYNKQIKHVEQNYPVASEEIQQEWKRLRSGARQAKASVVVSPLIKTGWDQDAPYWNLCPQKGSNYCYTGCVATAMAQVMNYWQWPKQGTGSHSVKYNGKTYTADFANTTYDWSNMKNSYSGSSTSAQKTAVATLMLHCGIAVDMQYGTSSEGGSAAYTIDYNGYFSGQGKMCAETALKQFFGYNSSTVKGYYRDGDSETGMKSWTKPQWIAMLKEELDAERPIMYAGCGYETPGDEESVYGHSFVCDGYDSSNYFHFNWGWGNWCDGYYDVDALNTNDPGSGGGNGEYNYYQDVIVGIQPPVVGHSVKTNGTGCTISCNNYANNDEAFTATITPTDATYDFTSLNVKLGSTTLTKTTHYTLSSDNKTLNIKASAITGDASNDLTITAVWTKNRYKYEMLGENCDPEMDEGMLAKNAALNLTILPASGYTLADASCWDVEMGGATLTYGTGFTYNSSNGAFAITEVTGDVAIVAYAGNAITWNANGTEFASTVALSNMIQLPTSEPEVECNGKVFVGWCADANYESESTAPTFVKNGDAVSEAKTFYAVFATPGTGGTTQKLIYLDADSVSASYGTNTEVTRCGITCYYTNVMKSNSSTIQMKKNGSYIANKDALTRIDSIVIEGTTALTVYAGTSTKPSSTSITRNGNKYNFSGGTYTHFSIYNENNNAVYADLIKIYYSTGGGSSYSDYTTICTAPCVGDLTSITLNTDNVKKVFTEGEAFTYEGLVVTANYDGCESKTVTPTSVSTPDMNQIGAQDVTVTYEGKSATYEITINALPTYTIRFFDNTTLLSSQNVKQGQAATPPTSDPTACEEYTFVGWYTAALAEDNTVAPSYVTNFTATKDQDYYAVFSRTEEGEGGSSKNVTFTASDLYSNEEAAGTKELEGVTFAYAIGSNTQNAPKYYSNGTSVRMYGGNTLTISAASAISAIQFTYGSTTAGFTANVGTLNDDAWTGNAESIVFTASGKHWIQVIVVTVGSGASSTTYYTTAPTCEECTAAVTITKGTPANGSFTLDKVGEQSTCDGQLVVTVSDIVPVSGYRFQAITQTGIEGAVIDQDNKTVTYAKKANGESTINVVFEAIPTYIISFYDNGTKISEQEVLEGESAEKPEDPEPACEAYTFEGWYTAELAANNTVKPTYVTDFTATKDQDYYAIFKKEETIGTAEQNYPYTFTSKSWADATNSWTSGQDGNQLTSGQGVQVTTGVSGAGATLNSSVENVSKVVVNYCTNASKGAGSITVTVGDDESTKNVTSTGGTSLRNLEFAFENKSGVVTFEVACTTNSIYVNAITITAGGSTTTTFYTSTVTASNCKWPTEVENTDDEKPAAVKALMNGQIVIIRGEAVYSITGVRIK